MEHSLDLTYHWAGFSALVVFVIAYAFVMAEEFTHLRKSLCLAVRPNFFNNSRSNAGLGGSSR